MSFADDLNNKVNEFNKNKPIVPDKETIISREIEHYTRDIKSLCVQRATAGENTLKGFFVPEREPSYDVTIGPWVIDKPQSYVTVKPTEGMYKNLTGGAYDLSYGIIRYGEESESEVNRIGNGILNNLSKEGFKKLSVLHIVGPKYVADSGFLGVRAIKKGVCHYFYLDIEW